MIIVANTIALEATVEYQKVNLGKEGEACGIQNLKGIKSTAYVL